MHRAAVWLRRLLPLLAASLCLAALTVPAQAVALPSLMARAVAAQNKATAFMTTTVSKGVVNGMAITTDVVGYNVRKADGLYTYTVTKSAIVGHTMTSYGYVTPTQICTKLTSAAPWQCTKSVAITALMKSFVVSTGFTHVKNLSPSRIDGTACQGLSGVSTTSMNTLGKTTTVTATIIYWIARATMLPVETVIKEHLAAMSTTMTVTYAGWNSASVAAHMPPVP